MPDEKQNPVEMQEKVSRMFGGEAGSPPKAEEMRELEAKLENLDKKASLKALEGALEHSNVKEAPEPAPEIAVPEAKDLPAELVLIAAYRALSESLTRPKTMMATDAGGLSVMILIEFGASGDGQVMVLGADDKNRGKLYWEKPSSLKVEMKQVDNPKKD